MNAPAGSNPEATAITEVTFGGSQKAAQPRPMRLGHGEIRGEVELAGLVESLALSNEARHTGS
ncbi:MAG: hypothetical protein ABSA78_08895 [Candidatus Sulfotelmatobacter sp.]|jgi:hypothetical protein